MKKKTTWIIAGAAAIVVLGGAGIAVAATDPFDQDNDRLTGSSLERASDAALAEVGGGTVTEAERSDDLDHAYTVEVRREDGSDVDVELDDDYKVVRVEGATTGVTSGQDSDSPSSEPTGAASGDDVPISADDRSSAEKAALDAAGPGTVTDLDRSDDADHAWEVEVTAADGSDVDVELDAQFAVVRIDSDQQ